MIFKCNKCSSTQTFIEKKGNNTGLYCSKCGKWITWLNKDQIRAFEHQKTESTVIGNLSDLNTQPKDSFAMAYYAMKGQLKAFIDFLDKEIDRQFDRVALSPEDAIMKSTYAHAYEKDKNALINILNGNDWKEIK